MLYRSCITMPRGFRRRQCQAHDGALVVALPLDLATELLEEGLDQPAADPGIGASRIDPLAVVSDRKVYSRGRANGQIE